MKVNTGRVLTLNIIPTDESLTCHKLDNGGFSNWIMADSQTLRRCFLYSLAKFKLHLEGIFYFLTKICHYGNVYSCCEYMGDCARDILLLCCDDMKGKIRVYLKSYR